MKKKLPVVGRPTPAQAQHELSVAPVRAASRPEFPTRSELARATLLATGLAGAGCGSPAKPVADPAPHPQPVAAEPTQPAKVESAQAPAPAPSPVVIAESQPVKPPIVEDKPVEPPPAPAMNGSVDGKELAKTPPTFKIYREGGGIGPAEDMWQEEEVEAFINWTMAKEGKLDLKTNYAFELDGVQFKIDAFDPVKNVGYEYVDKLDDERAYFTKDVRAKFDAWMKERRAAILFIEVKKNPDAATLRGKIVKFLNAVKAAPPAPKA
ncbi:MAG: hypothetical protein JNL83_11660 [Myxococcales bacterium]|nr:hypothetical protein [Myxococcales bacterium]